MRLFADRKAHAHLTKIIGYDLQDQPVADPFLAFGLNFKEIGPVLEPDEAFELLPVRLHRGVLSAKALASLGSAGGNNTAAILRCHARAEAVTAGANDFARLICALGHVLNLRFLLILLSKERLL